MTRILIAEDEERIARFLEKGLRASGYSTTIARNGHEALGAAHDDDFDLVILDLGLPGIDGHTVLHEVRARGEQLPVVILTARADAQDTLRGLEGGADDYMTKPFRFDELLARIRLRLRDSRSIDPALLRAGDLTLDVRERRAVIDNQVVDLSMREFAVLETLIRHAGQVLTREQLLAHAWGYDFDPGSNVVDVYIRYLRRKIGADCIETIRGMGYRLRAGPSAPEG
jgi:DNA-binding response OmpR family regulator